MGTVGNQRYLTIGIVSGSVQVALVSALIVFGSDGCCSAVGTLIAWALATTVHRRAMERATDEKIRANMVTGRRVACNEQASKKLRNHRSKGSKFRITLWKLQKTQTKSTGARASFRRDFETMRHSTRLFEPLDQTPNRMGIRAHQGKTRPSISQTARKGEDGSARYS